MKETMFQKERKFEAILKRKDPKKLPILNLFLKSQKARMLTFGVFFCR